MRLRSLSLGALLLSALGAGCAGGPGTGAASVPEEPPVVLLIDEEGPWREIPIGGEAGEAVAAGSPAAAPPPPARVRRPPPAPVPSRPSLAVPRRRVTREPGALGSAPPKTPRDLARERFLDHPTRIEAGRITFHCPRPFVREVRLTGDDVTRPKAGRRVAIGRARLTCRELTLEGDRVELRIRNDADADLQLTARGNVRFVTDQRGQLLREEGARSLLLKNDRVIPLR